MRVLGVRRDPALLDRIVDPLSSAEDLVKESVHRQMREFRTQCGVDGVSSVPSKIPICKQHGFLLAVSILYHVYPGGDTIPVASALKSSTPFFIRWANSGGIRS